MGWEIQTISVTRRYRHRDGDYEWTTPDFESVTGWEEILSVAAAQGWELVSACVAASEIYNTRTEASCYQLFFKRPTRDWGPPRPDRPAFPR